MTILARARLGYFLFLLPGLVGARAVETTWEYSVRVSSVVQASPARITLHWPQDVNGAPLSYAVYRKAPADPTWGRGLTLSGGSTTFTDTEVSVGTAYQSRVVKTACSYMGT